MSFKNPLRPKCLSTWLLAFCNLQFCFFFLSPLSARAQPANPFPACLPQIEDLCRVGAEGKPLNEAREVLQCLRRNADKLSDPCKGDLERYAQAARQAAARSGGSLSGFGGLTSLTPPIPIITYEGRYTPKGPGADEHRVAISSPVFGSETGITSASLSASDLHFHQPVVLSSGQTLPRELYRAEVGVQYSRRLENKKSLGLRFTTGFTGDQIFQSLRDTSFSATATYGFPGKSAGDYWVALVYFANNSPLGDYIPIPGIVYVHRTEHFTGIFGFPALSLQWTPDPRWAYSFSIFGTTVITEAAYGSVTASQIFVQGSFNQQRFILHDRIDDRDRLTLQEVRAGLGYRSPLFNSVFGEIQIGHASNRSAYIGDKIFRRDRGSRDLDDSAFVTGSLKAAF